MQAQSIISEKYVSVLQKTMIKIIKMNRAKRGKSVFGRGIYIYFATGCLGIKSVARDDLEKLG